VADIARLGDRVGPPVVEVVPSGDLENPLSVDAAVYRLAQESITTVRHSAGPRGSAWRPKNRLRALTVSDDGVPPSGSGFTTGYGIVGMTERANLLAELLPGPGHDGAGSPRCSPAGPV
jgi:signal transduction histidine kinase